MLKMVLGWVVSNMITLPPLRRMDRFGNSEGRGI